MPTRREFIEFVAGTAGAGDAIGSLLGSIAQAASIEPERGSSFLDAEHVVILMQENRSFDHVFGTLRGVRGFNDPRALTLGDGNPVWVQANAEGKRYAPFRHDLKNSKITWMGSLPHDRTDQVDARNHGLYDRWLIAKESGRKEYKHLPLTLGYFTREDVPFYYALADAFTVCDQNFCSSLTATTPNRLHLWTGTVRAKPDAQSPAHVRNEDVDHDHLAGWTTFPERLEEWGVAWKVYQNELTVESGLNEEEDRWLSNFGDNPLEYFRQYHVHSAKNHCDFVARRLKQLPDEIQALEQQVATLTNAAEREKRNKQLDELRATQKKYDRERASWEQNRLEKLPERERALHAKAFCTNVADPAFRKLLDVTYRDGDNPRQMRVPKGDVLQNFRKDVGTGTLPTVSWLVSPETFSDHPSSAWFGAWYIAEVLDILTANPEVWKKTIFVVTYDENDGYFDHVPPFVPPHPHRPETGKVTKGIDAAVEYVELEQDRKVAGPSSARESAIGLGYRVPLIVASPWSRGGCVCSQVFDHTSVLQLLEKFLSHKLGKKVEEPNINRWRRAVCGDLTSAFQSPAKGDRPRLKFPPRNDFLQMIHNAKFKDLPIGPQALSAAELEKIRRDPKTSVLPRQEPGVRPSSPLPYELVVDGSLNATRTHFEVRFEARNDAFGDRSAGSAFIVYALVAPGEMRVRNYAVEPGAQLEDSWKLSDFDGGRYHLRVYGPNGFFREFKGSVKDPLVAIALDYCRSEKPAGKLSGSVRITSVNNERSATISLDVRTSDGPAAPTPLAPGQKKEITFESPKRDGWYDVVVRQGEFVKRYAGRVETGKWSTSDPAMA
ncbi:phosphocholine-specific phospholipase C [Frigoriglobus tundricola]|uniref:phospholipase C n=1 Tax=Frigoriglobus tundricola TaxID=2774151 RepID=A0A6M5Z5G8_9BACT|nr:phospholipase C, phosphocholine-specific [Frigoriglobus tundricola]QJX00684.1 Phospholipase C [Frigoriglobus tundricola]